MKKNKAIEPDKIVIKMLKTLYDFSIDKEIYNNSEITEDHRRSICHQNQVQMDVKSTGQSNNLNIRILINRASSRIKPEIENQKCNRV